MLLLGGRTIVFVVLQVSNKVLDMKTKIIAVRHGERISFQGISVRGLSRTYLDFGDSWICFVLFSIYVTCYEEKDIPSFHDIFHYTGKFHGQIEFGNFIYI